jgi:hypothetical protein
MLSNAMNIIKGYSWDKAAARAAVREDEQIIEKEHLLPVTSTYVHPRAAKSAAEAAAAAASSTTIGGIGGGGNSGSAPVTSTFVTASAPVVSGASRTAAAVEVAGEVGAFVGGLGGVPIGVGGGVKELWTNLTRPKGAPPVVKERKGSAIGDAVFANEVQLQTVCDY